MATRNAARTLGLPAVGTVACGHAADLLILDDNPPRDTRNTRRIHGVVVDARWIPPEDRPPGAHGGATSRRTNPAAPGGGGHDGLRLRRAPLTPHRRRPRRRVDPAAAQRRGDRAPALYGARFRAPAHRGHSSPGPPHRPPPCLVIAAPISAVPQGARGCIDVRLRRVGAISPHAASPAAAAQPIAAFTAKRFAPIPAVPIDALTAPTYLPPSKRFDASRRIDSTPSDSPGGTGC
ncbi:amidohydrolase family protein [Streptomyces sp. NBC_00988]|uniref:hypothetical protein n=1 Tax=Streptomyces sp. NBC_00988 TaxID=2903704 RepID=UPI00386EA4DB|nr:amidohydrolase family protein [Streptomyces sp. NBC_00988]